MDARRYQLDWLRVLAFGLLIPFHVAMLYVSWWYPIKSPRLMPGLEWVLLLITPWRMALVFVISGVACRYLIGKLGPGRFALDRLRRLLPVILFGVFVVNGPQTWIVARDHGLTGAGLMDFWWHYVRADHAVLKPPGMVMPRWDHLWFLLYLLPYTMLFALVWKGTPKRFRVPLTCLLVAPAIWLVVTGTLVDNFWPRTDALWGDWGQHLKWLGLFGLGTAIAMRDDVWTWLERNRLRLLILTMLLGGALLADHALWLKGALHAPWDWISSDIISGVFAWLVIAMAFGYATNRLNRPSRTLAYLNVAILPVYVLHQPILFLAAFNLFPRHLPLAVEAILLTAITIFGSLAIYHLAIRPFSLMRMLFGLRTARNMEKDRMRNLARSPIG